MRSICQTVGGGSRHPPDPLAAEVVELVVEEVAESMAGATDPSLRHKLAELAAPLSSLSWARVTGHCPLARPGECRATVTHRARPDQSGA